MNKGKAAKAVWKVLVGGAITVFGAMRLLPHLAESGLSVETTLYIALIAVGLSVVGGALD